mgnify:FL=1
MFKKINSIDKITLDKLVIIDVSPAKLKFKFEKKNTKKVPIIFNSKIQYSKQFGLKNKIRMSPDSVVISGPQEDIQSIQNWEVNPVNIVDIADDQNLSLSLKPAENSNVLLANNKVSVYISVEKYTTKRISVPIHIKAMAPFEKIAIYPQKAELTFLVGISKYKSINENAFRVIAVQEKKSRNKLKLKIDHAPSGIQNLAIAPHLVDYLIYNK